MSKRLRIVIAATAPILTAAVLVLKDFILGLKRYLPDCTFNTVTGYLCPGCGNTRSLTYLLNGDILSALRCNVTIPFLGMLLVLLYIENAAAIAGKDVKLLPRNSFVWAGVIVLFFAYFTARNFIPNIAPI